MKNVNTWISEKGVRGRTYLYTCTPVEITYDGITPGLAAFKTGSFTFKNGDVLFDVEYRDANGTIVDRRLKNEKNVTYK